MLYRLSYEASTGAGRGNLGKYSMVIIVVEPRSTREIEMILIRVDTQGIWCIGSIAYFRHLTVV